MCLEPQITDQSSHHGNQIGRRCSPVSVLQILTTSHSSSMKVLKSKKKKDKNNLSMIFHAKAVNQNYGSSAIPSRIYSLRKLRFIFPSRLSVRVHWGIQASFKCFTIFETVTRVISNCWKLYFYSSPPPGEEVLLRIRVMWIPSLVH